MLERLLTRIRPDLEEHGDYTAARAAMARVRASGNGVARQRHALRSGSLATVLDLLTHTTDRRLLTRIDTLPTLH